MLLDVPPLPFIGLSDGLSWALCGGAGLCMTVLPGVLGIAAVIYVQNRDRRGPPGS